MCPPQKGLDGPVIASGAKQSPPFRSTTEIASSQRALLARTAGRTQPSCNGHMTSGLCTVVVLEMQPNSSRCPARCCIMPLILRGEITDAWPSSHLPLLSGWERRQAGRSMLHMNRQRSSQQRRCIPGAPGPTRSAHRSCSRRLGTIYIQSV